MPDDSQGLSRIASDYFKEVGENKLPTKEEEKTLFTTYRALRDQEDMIRDPNEKAKITRQCTKVKHQLACWYLRFVIMRARKRSRDPLLLQELISEGNIGLMIGIERFEVDRGNRFLTYASNWIDVYMQEHLNRLGQVHVPNHARKELRKKKLAEEKMMALGLITQHTVEEPTIAPLDPTIHAGHDDTSDAAMESEYNPMEYLEGAELTRCEKLVLVYYFGLRSGVSRTFGEIAQIFYELDGSIISSDRIRQIKDRAVGYVKQHMLDRGITAGYDLM